MRELDTYTAVAICEGFEDPEGEHEELAAWQCLIDSGLAWQLQGFFGRQANWLISQGYCHAPQ